MQRGKPFKKGESGNPAGKKPGTRHRATIIAEQLIDAEAEELVRVCLDKAKAGDPVYMKLAMDRLIGVRKDRPISLALPQLENAEDAVKAMKSIANAVSESKITPSEAQILSAVIENYRKVTETTEIEKRLTALEARNNQK